MADIGGNNSRQGEDNDETICRIVPGIDDDNPPACLASHGRNKKIVLHVDLNNTILVSDAVTCQGTVAALDYFMTTVTWGKMNKGKWEWLSDSPSLLPPCDGAVSYYSQFGSTQGFTSASGRRFRGILEEHLNLLRWPEGVKGDRELTIKAEDGRLYHWIIPSFFQLLKDLTQQGTQFAVHFRTFGSDLPRVLSAVSKALTQGAHPLFPDLPELKLNVNKTPGKIRCSTKGVLLTRGADRLSTRDGERGLYEYFSTTSGLGGFQDDYEWWLTNKYSIRGGKPLWVDPFDENIQHIFIDDNIRQDDEDTVVHPKVFLEPGSANTRTACISELYDIALVQTDLLKAISEPDYFTRRVRICQENYEKNVQQGSS
ncbi:uncharacterized protein LOC129191218 [Dunckerocampus dactyliophorus]|uniref:uncharacterized protein LOC129190978 n=1 Tax=Dunckerocampus dactyliophorus TaxID=161453 RepID=UPI0024056A2E|nr:uncharacterized protein LOC129190978 [Dunckerocampus dactyliophorus]XP_054650341.1 uncharacterized protein LOC129191218 [Dunckerocampus dactyliophorus]